jgi:pimeloyl-ACP methyl ester carboxylesterase
MSMVETMVKVNGVELCVDTFGDPDDPAILLIGGAAMSMDWWEEEFCERLADRFVIRYDNRDTGRSASWPAGAPGYRGSELVTDAVGVLDALGVAQAHLVGVSMGGGIAQQVALEHPARVASLTLIATSPLTHRPGAPELPPPAEPARAAFANPPPEPDRSDRAAVIEYLVEVERPFRGSLARDEAALRATVGRIVDRTVDIAAATTNHWVMDHGDPVQSTLDAVAVPTLVLHGTEDSLFPYPHGEALVEEIPGARLIPLVGMGHEVPPRAVWDIVIPALLAHTAGV